jgi:hypothetical protein
MLREPWPHERFVDPDRDDPFAAPAPEPGYLYLFHFTAPLAHAKHYLGWASQGRHAA